MTKRIKAKRMRTMRLRKAMALLTSLSLMLVASLPARAASEAKKEEAIYVTLGDGGKADAAYAVNIFPAGVVMDYGDYTDVRMMNTEEELTYANGRVYFIHSENRAYYQGNLANVELPWLFDITWTLNGQEAAAHTLAGATGEVEMHMSIRENPECDGDFFDTHALQIAASLDTKKCSHIVAEGATQANVGSSRQLNWIILPGTESDIALTADVTDFEMPAMSISGIRMTIDPGGEMVDDAKSLADGLEELGGHNEEINDGAKQIVQTALDSANEELQASKRSFDQLGITLNTLTMENYDSEIERLQTELLDKVDDYVHRQAEQELRRQVRKAAEEMVRAEVEKAARVQAEQEVRKAAEEQVRQAVTQEARKQVEEAMRNPTDENIDALVEAQMQTEEVQSMIDANVEVQMASPEVQAQIDAEIEAIARPQVEAAVEAEVRRQVEAAVRETVRQGVEKAVEAKIRAEVTKEMGGSVLPSDTPEIPGLAEIIEALPTFDPSGGGLPGMDTDELKELIEALPTFAPSVPSGLPDVSAGGIGDLIEALPTFAPSLPGELPDVSAGGIEGWIETLPTPDLPGDGKLPDYGMTETPSAEPADEPTAEPGGISVTLPAINPEKIWKNLSTMVPLDLSGISTTGLPAAASEGGTAKTQNASPTAAPSGLSIELPGMNMHSIWEGLSTMPPLDLSGMIPSMTPEAQKQTTQEPVSTGGAVNLLGMLIPSAKAESRSVIAEMETEVAVRMASAEVQQEMEALTDAAMASETTQALIDAQVKSRMESPEVQAIIEAEVTAQVTNPAYRAEAEEIARAEVRRQVEAVARGQVRAAIYAKLSAMTDEERDAMVDTQMQSEQMRQLIEQETAAQMETEAVQAMIDTEVDKQMKTATVQAMIDEECAAQMESRQVQSQIESEIAVQRNSTEYLNSVAKALEENGRNGKAYQALVSLRETMDDLMRFYDGLIEYTDGVAEAADGVREARGEVENLLGEEDAENPRETRSFVSEKNGAVKSVQFVMTTPAIKVSEKTEPVPADEDGIAGMLGKLFR